MKTLTQSLWKALIIVLFFCSNLQAQWDSSNPPYLYTNTNLVGIGTATPTEELQIENPVSPYENATILIRGEKSGIIVDEGTNRRTGLIKYPWHRAGIWRAENVDFEIGRVNVASLPGNPTSFSTDLYVSGGGNIGIGTTSPSHLLHLKTELGRAAGPSIRLENPGGAANSPSNLEIASSASFGRLIADKGMAIFINANGDAAGNVATDGSPENYFSILSNAGSWSGAEEELLRVAPNGTTTVNGTIVSVTNNVPYNYGFQCIAGNEWTKGISIGMNPNSDNFLVYANGMVQARSLRITYDNFWDFVFDSDYKLRTIGELEEFISKNKHLPDIPSEKEIQEMEHYDVGEFQGKLLQKVEELSLYVIDLQKQITELKQKGK